jgi:hypothetical protein
MLLNVFGFGLVASEPFFLPSRVTARNVYVVRPGGASFRQPIINGPRNWSPSEIATLFEQTCFVAAAHFDSISILSERIGRIGWNKSQTMPSGPLTNKQTTWNNDGLKIVYTYWTNGRHVECEIRGAQGQTPSASDVVGALKGKLHRRPPKVIPLWKGGPKSYNWIFSNGGTDRTNVKFVNKPLETPGDYTPEIPAELRLRIERNSW